MSAAPTADDLRRSAAELRRLSEAMEAGAAYAEARARDFAECADPILLAPATRTSSSWRHELISETGRTLSRMDHARGVCTWYAKAKFGARASYEHPTRWFGHETLFDTAGREWVRVFEAVIDDFGDLVEVAQ